MKRLQNFSQLLLQVLALVLIWLLSDWIVRTLAVPVPAGVLGLGLVVLCMFKGWLPLDYVQLGAEWLLAEMMLFFVPAMVSISRFSHLIAERGMILLLVLLLGCLVVMAGTGWVVDRVFHFEQRRHARREAEEAA